MPACEVRDFEDLKAELMTYKTLLIPTDLDSKKRLIRSLEISSYESSTLCKKTKFIINRDYCVYKSRKLGVSA